MICTFKHIILTVILVLLVIIPSKSQDFVYRNFNASDGLPSTEVYICFQDSKGYMWFGTDNGVSRFDGYEYINYDIQCGLASGTVSDIFEDKKGRIWFISLTGQLSIYENNKLTAYKFNSVIQNEIKGFRLHIKSAFYVDSLDNVFISMADNGIFKISRGGKLSRVDKLLVPATVFIKEIYPNIHMAGYVSTFNTKYGLENLNFKDSVYKNVFGFFPTNSLYFIVQNQKDEIYFTHNNYIYDITQKKINKVAAFENDIIWFKKDNEGKYWVSVRNNGIMLFNKPDFNKNPDLHFLPGKDVSSIARDIEGGFWFSTLNEGVFYLPTGEVRKIILNEKESQSIVSAEISREYLFVGYADGRLVVHDKENFNTVKSYQITENLAPSALKYNFQLDKLIVGTYKCILLLDKGKFQWLKTSYPNNNRGWKSTKRIKNSTNGLFYTSSNLGFDKFNENGTVFESFKDIDFNKTVNDLIENPDSSLWLGTNEGLWHFKNGLLTNWAVKNTLLSYRINAMHKSGNKLYLATKGAGLVILDLKNDSVSNISQKDGITSNYVSSVLGYKNQIWLGTNRGLTCIEPLDDEHYISKIIDKGSGLVNEEIKSMVLDSNKLYVVTKSGLNYINLDKYRWSTVKPMLHIEKIRINYKDTVLKDHLSLNYYQNNLQVEYVAISFKSNKKILYKYKLLPLDEKWNDTYKTNLNYTTLPPGKYKLLLKARNEDGIWSETIDNLSFTIEKPFWKKWWFFSIIALLGLLFSFLILNTRLQKLYYQNKLKSQLNDYMKNTSSLIINDHFLFNSLNSLNLLILSGEKLESSRLLAKISNYLRSVLVSMKKDFISLSDEINSLKLYLDIEKQRLKENFQYHLEIAKNINPLEILVPGTFIQPFLETVIWSEKTNQMNKVILNIKIEKVKNVLVININASSDMIKTAQDNGHLTTKETGSEKIVENIEKRANLLKNLYRCDIKVQYLNGSTKNLILEMDINKLKNLVV
ncbi:MAG: two-component regulator propeller domain-containing protein [Bacteroidales bacterium]